MESKRILNNRIGKKALALLLALMLMVPVFAGVPAKAAGSLTSIGLAEHGLMAYRDGWQYLYGGYGQKVDGVHYSDCSGLIFSYLCWTGSGVDINWYMPRGATQQYKACSQTGDISTLPRTHGLLLFNKESEDNCEHVGIYVGNGKSVDNSNYSTNMRYRDVAGYSGWNTWGKLSQVEYPTTGWYDFDGSPFYYEDGQYVVSTSRTIGDVTYTFDSAGTPSPTPEGYENGSSGAPDNVSIPAKTTADVNLRTGGSLSSSIIYTVSEGDSITILNKDSSDWYKVKTSNGTVGYMSANYISETGDGASNGGSAVSIPAVTTAYVNVRKGAGTSSDVITTVDSGTNITIIEKTNSSWYKIQLADGTTGYMYTSYIKETTEAPSTPPTESYSAKTTAYVNFRKSASITADVITLVDENTVVTVLDTSNADWYKVQLSNGTEGYISSKYLEKYDGGSDTPAPPSDSNGATGTVTAYLNFRTAPEISDGNVIDVIPSGASVTIVETPNSSWYKISYNGKEGYVYSQYVATASGSSNTAVTTAYVNLRDKAGMDGNVLLVVDSGTTVTVLDRSNTQWFKVQLSSGKSGYIFSEYLK